MKKWLLAFAMACAAHPANTTITPYMTTAGEVQDGIAGVAFDVPACVLVGNYKCAPIRAEYRCMTLDGRANWWDNHQEPGGCTIVMVLRETTRTEP